MLNFYLNLLDKLQNEEEGQTMAEYAVVLGVITVAAVLTLGLLGNTIASTLTDVIGTMP